MNKLYVILMCLLRCYGTISAMQVTNDKIVVELYDDQCTVISEKELDELRSFCSENIREFLTLHDGLISLPSLSKEVFEALVAHLKKIAVIMNLAKPLTAQSLKLFGKGGLVSDEFHERLGTIVVSQQQELDNALDELSSMASDEYVAVIKGADYLGMDFF